VARLRRPIGVLLLSGRELARDVGREDGAERHRGAHRRDGPGLAAAARRAASRRPTLDRARLDRDDRRPGGVGLVARPERAWAPPIGSRSWGSRSRCLAWTIGSLYAQATPKRLPLASAAAIEMLAAALVNAVVSRLLGEDLARVAEASPRAWGGLAYLVVFGSLVGFTAFAYCLNELPATTVGTYAYVNPVVAVFLGWLILGEALTPGLVTGGALIVLSVVLTTLRKPGVRS